MPRWHISDLVGDLPLQLLELPLSLFLQAAPKLYVVLDLLQFFGEILTIDRVQSTALAAAAVLRLQINFQAFPQFRPLLGELRTAGERQFLSRQGCIILAPGALGLDGLLRRVHQLLSLLVVRREFEPV